MLFFRTNSRGETLNKIEYFISDGTATFKDVSSSKKKITEMIEKRTHSRAQLLDPKEVKVCSGWP